MGRPKGSKNKGGKAENVKVAKAESTAADKAKANEEFDKINTKLVAVTPPVKTSPRKRKREAESPVKESASNGVKEKNGKSSKPKETKKENTEDNSTKTLKIIQLGTEVSGTKYAILPSHHEDGEESDDDDYADREDHEISYIADEIDYDEDEDQPEYGDEGELGIESDETSTIRHAKKYPSKQKYPCPKCPKVWNWAWELRRHLVVHFKPSKYGDGGFKCKQCDKRFQWKRDLKQHERYHTGEKVLFCSVCEKQFITKQALLHHVVVHTGEKPFQCAVCGAKFTQPANLRTHVKKRHNYNPEANKNNKCEYCGEPHQSVVSLHQHLLEDHPQQVQEEREILSREKQVRLREKMNKEKEKEERRRKREALGHKVRKPKRKEWEMDFEFYIGDGLVRGVDWDRTPSNGEIACGQCERKFGWRFEIMFHGLCHLLDDQGNARNKICPECDTPFKVPIGLKHHLITHTGETPFLCLHCWKSFSSHVDLKLHVKKEHLLHSNKSKSAKKEEEEESAEHVEDAVLEEQTSHFVQLEDGTYAEMIDESANIIVPGQPILVKNDKGETMVVVNSPEDNISDKIEVGPPGQVYVIASQGSDKDTILPDKESLERLIGESDSIEMIVEDDSKVIQVNEM